MNATQKAQYRARVLKLLETCDYAIEVTRYFERSGEHSFIASWKSPNRAYCGVCGADKQRNCGHDDGGLCGQAFVCNLKAWTIGKNAKELRAAVTN
jgi:hypothetical protein